MRELYRAGIYGKGLGSDCRLSKTVKIVYLWDGMSVIYKNWREMIGFPTTFNSKQFLNNWCKLILLSRKRESTWLWLEACVILKNVKNFVNKQETKVKINSSQKLL